jgi:hypothetical protein
MVVSWSALRLRASSTSIRYAPFAQFKIFSVSFRAVASGIGSALPPVVACDGANFPQPDAAAHETKTFAQPRKQEV